MINICLIDMPFAGLSAPSLGLTQLKARLDEEYKTIVKTEVLYLNQDFGNFFGVGLYNLLASSLEHHGTGIGEWLFRQVAFPELLDNSDEYFQRYYSQQNERTRMLVSVLKEKRAGLEGFMDGLLHKYSLCEANMVGFTSMFAQNTASFALARKIKSNNPKAITIIGGPNCEAPMGAEIAKSVSDIDFVFSGPALRSLPQFVQYWLDGQSERLHRIKGVISKKNVNIHTALPSLDQGAYTGSMGAELDINTEIPLDYHPFLDALDRSFPHGEVSSMLFFQTSRGCWWGERSHCTFCGLNGLSMNYRHMNSEKALRLFQDMFSYSTRNSRLFCVDDIAPKPYFTEVFPNLKTPENTSIFYELRADLSNEDVAVLASARINTIQPGIEALATSTLKLMKKGTTVFTNLRLLKNCAIHDVHPAWNLLVGFPGEQEAVYEKYVKDIPLLYHLPPPSGTFPVRFDRYSPYFDRAAEFGLELSPLDFYSLTFPFNQKVLDNFAYYFSDNNIGEYRLILGRWIDKLREAVEAWRMSWLDDEYPPMLHLAMADRRTVIRDTRTGTETRYEIDGVREGVLNYLSTPRKLSDLTTYVERETEYVYSDIYEWLCKERLIFQERDRVISLVLPVEPTCTNIRQHL